jgi:nuclear transport factor 2 (NTF2) superfamily protein
MAISNRPPFTQEKALRQVRAAENAWQGDLGQWFRSYGNELSEFDDDGPMRRREASIKDVRIADSVLKFFWPTPGPRPADHPGIPDVE